MKTKKKMIVAAMLAAISSVAFGAAGVLANAANKETERTKINYEIKPEISVEFPEGFSGALPNAVLNKNYKIPAATAVDVYGDALSVRTVLYAHYYSETRSLIQIENNTFTPAFYGVYTVCYTATDDFGNVAVETFDILCEERQPLTASIAQTSGEYFAGREVKIADITVENAIGKIDVQATATCAYASYPVENSVFVPEYAGEYTIEYTYSDYSETNHISYTMTVQDDATPVFVSGICLPEYFILGANYTMPEGKCKAYRAGAVYSIAPTLSVNYVSKNYSEEIVGGVFAPKMEGDIVITYEASAFGKSEKREYSAKVVDVNFTGAMTMEKYFQGEDIGLSASSYGVAISTLKNGASAAFINSVLSQTLTMNLGIDADKNAFSSLDIYLTDAEDKSQVVKISFEKANGNAKMVVNDDDYAYTTVTFEQAANFAFEYINSTRTVSMAGSDKIEVLNTLSGEPFQGFGEFITVKYVFDGVDGYSTAYVYSIDNQSFSNEKGDGMRPYIIFSTYSEGYRKVGELVQIDRIYVADVLDPNYTVKYYVVAPSGKFVIDVAGELLDMDTDYTKEYTFLAAEKGKYVVYMEVEDSAGNNEIYAYSINVINTSAPEITLSGVNTEVPATSSITLATATVWDDATPADKMSVYVVVLCPNWETVMAENGKVFKPDQYGTYTVYYYVTDGDGNIAMESYQFTVK